MNEVTPREFISASELITILKNKYGQNEKEIGIKHRFPASLIFFSSKKEYYYFLEQAPWDFHRLSSIFQNDKIPSEIKFNKWFNDALDSSRDNPLILTPLTEYIRFYSKEKISLLFNKILQSEGAKIIVPLLDFYYNYQYFIKNYFHTNRMAEVFAQNESLYNDDKELEIIFDRTGNIFPTSYDVIKTPKEWILLWETGEIALKNKLLVQNLRIIDIIEKADISVPRIKRHSINDFNEYLQYEYSIPKSVLNIEPTSEIIDFILSNKEDLRNQRSWTDFENTILGAENEFEERIYKFWEYNQKNEKKINRWFWLNKAKSTEFHKKILDDVIIKLNDPERLLDEIYLFGLKNKNIDINLLSERREILSKFNEPLFFNINPFKETFDEAKKQLGNNPLLIIERVIGYFDFEKSTILEIFSHLMKYQSCFNKKHFGIIKETWPEFAEYIESTLDLKLTKSFTIVDEFPQFAELYIPYYILSKVVYDQPTEELDELQNEFRKQWNDINAGIITGKIQSHESGFLPAEIKDKKYIFLDGVGFEWTKLIQFLLIEHGWQVIELTPIFAPLPSVTEFFPFEKQHEEKSVERIDAFDRLIHESYEYPYTIIREIQTLKEIFHKIHKRYQSYTQPLWIVSDHGTTAFARKGATIKNFKDKDKKHGGRYARLTQKSFLETNDLKIIDRDRKFVVSLTYDNLGKTCPRGEAHGGGTPEEILAFALKVLPPAIKQKPSISISLQRSEFSLLEKEIKLYLEGSYQHKVEDIKILINKSPRFILDMQYYSQRTLTLPIPFLKEKGLIVGHNEIKLIINNLIEANCNVKITSGSEKTGFDEKFNF